MTPPEPSGTPGMDAAGPGRTAGVCAVALAAGEGSRLRPLTEVRPKALCPVGNVALLDRVLDRLAAAGLAGPADVAVNACYLAEQVVGHVGDRAHLSVEAPPALGTAGGVANLRGWIAGRAVLVCNADAYLSDAATTGAVAADPATTGAVAADLASQPAEPGRGGGRAAGPVEALLAGWDGAAIRVLTVPAGAGRRGDFGPGRRLRYAGMCLLPWSVVEALEVEPSELFVAWRAAEAAGTLELVRFGGTFVDCGTPADYLAANLDASGGASVVGDGATVAGELERAVVWPGATVAAGERLVDAVRASWPDGSPLTVPGGPPDGLPPAVQGGPPDGVAPTVIA
jgi:MurNAc alpha-1-phosphate uridylyltransferase